MAYSDTSISIHLIKDSKAINTDDTIRILKNLDDSVFEIIYKDSDETLAHKSYHMTRDNVCDYVYLLLKNLTLDEDGYKMIQLSLPAMPRLLISAVNLHSPYYRDHFIELIENGLNMIDKVEKLSIKKPSQKKNYSCHADIHSQSCIEVKNANFLPKLPVSPVHRYFE
jgi:hypothetical protein